MSNYAALIGPISIGGSLTTAGLPNVNGKVWAFLPGTTTPANLYADPAAQVVVTQPVTLDAGGRVPYATYPNGLYTTQPIRLLIQDVNGVNVSDTTFESGADSTGLSDASYTGTTVRAALDAIAASVGGVDGLYVPFIGASGITVKSALSGIQLVPQLFGAIGDGSHDDTVAIQAMINALASLGGGVGFFPPTKASYKVSATLVIPASALGITFAGASRSSTINCTSTSDVFTASSAQGIAFRNLTISGSLGLTGVAGLIFDNVIINRGSTSSAYAISLVNSSIVTMQDSIIIGGTKVISATGSTQNVYLERCSLSSSGTTICVDLANTASSVFVKDSIFSAGSGGVTGIKFESGYTGATVAVSDCPSLGGLATPIDVSAISNDPGIVTRNVSMDFTLFDNLVADAGHSVTPSTLFGTNELRVTSVSGGASITVNPPTPIPTASQKGKVFTTYHVNNSGGGVTWVFPASAGQYLTNVSVPTANNTKFNMSWKWDGSNWNLNSTGQAV